MDISEKNRSKIIKKIANLLENSPFSMEIVAKKNPKGIRLIYECTEEELEEFRLIQHGQTVKN